jgi:hypothetical protein
VARGFDSIPHPQPMGTSPRPCAAPSRFERVQLGDVILIDEAAHQAIIVRAVEVGGALVDHPGSTHAR